jgi:hypothetical protein
MNNSKHIRMLLPVLLVLFIPGYSLLAAELEAAPLFASKDLLEITLAGTFRTINRSRDKEREYDRGLMSWVENAQENSLEVKYEVRGNFRLREDICNFAQLWVDMDKDDVDGTVFAQQNSLKLVVQCKNAASFERYIVKEHQAYQLFNVISDLSYRSRLLRVTYLDTDRDSERTHLGVFIEHKDGVAERNEMENVDLNSIGLAELDQLQGTIVSLFMFMVGNTDFSLISAPEDECCHNAKLFQVEGENHYFPAPYDFDSTGYVNASYAQINPSLRIRSVRQRLYRGFCVSENIMNEALSHFRTNEEQLLAIAADTTYVNERTARTSVEYLQDFFAIINDPEELQDEILDDCRG